MGRKDAASGVARDTASSVTKTMIESNGGEEKRRMNVPLSSFRIRLSDNEGPGDF